MIRRICGPTHLFDALFVSPNVSPNGLYPLRRNCPTCRRRVVSTPPTLGRNPRSSRPCTARRLGCPTEMANQALPVLKSRWRPSRGHHRRLPTVRMEFPVGTVAQPITVLLFVEGLFAGDPLGIASGVRRAPGGANWRSPMANPALIIDFSGSHCRDSVKGPPGRTSIVLEMHWNAGQAPLLTSAVAGSPSPTVGRRSGR